MVSRNALQNSQAEITSVSSRLTTLEFTIADYDPELTERLSVCVIDTSRLLALLALN